MVDANSANNAVTNAGTNNTNLITELDQKLADIEKRLAEIAGYQDVPPAIANEKESLQKRRDILLATKTRLSGAGSNPSVPAPSESIAPSVPAMPPAPVREEMPKPAAFDEAAKVNDKPNEEAPVDIPQEKKNTMTDKWSKPPVNTFAPKQEESKIENKAIALDDKAKTEDDSLLGESYSVLDEDEDKTEEDENIFVYKKQKPEEKVSVGDIDFDGSALSENLGKASTGKIFEKIKEGIGIFEGILSSSKDHPDREYLNKVCQTLKKAVDNLDKRSKEVKMSENHLKQAVIGRVTNYFELAKAEFDFSGLLESDVENKLKDLFDKA